MRKDTRGHEGEYDPGPAGLTEIERRQKIKVKKAAELNDLSEASFRRHYRHLIRKITPRRDAVELGDAIDLPPPKAK